MNDKELIERGHALAELYPAEGATHKTLDALADRVEVLPTPEPEPSDDQLVMAAIRLSQTTPYSYEQALQMIKLARVEVTRDELAKAIWETSRIDESTISAMGANVVAEAVLSRFRVSRRDGEDKK